MGKFENQIAVGYLLTSVTAFITDLAAFVLGPVPPDGLFASVGLRISEPLACLIIVRTLHPSRPHNESEMNQGQSRTVVSPEHDSAAHECAIPRKKSWQSSCFS